MLIEGAGIFLFWSLAFYWTKEEGAFSLLSLYLFDFEEVNYGKAGFPNLDDLSLSLFLGFYQPRVVVAEYLNFNMIDLDKYLY